MNLSGLLATQHSSPLGLLWELQVNWWFGSCGLVHHLVLIGGGAVSWARAPASCQSGSKNLCGASLLLSGARTALAGDPIVMGNSLAGLKMAE